MSPTAPRLSRPLSFDLTSQAYKRDPYPTLAAMRAAGPVIPIKLPLLGKAWLTTTHASSTAMTKDNATFVQEGRNAGRSGVAGWQWWMPNSLKALAANMLQRDEPDHRRLRKLVDRAFARHGVLDMRGAIEAIADRVLDALEGRAEADLTLEFSRRLPVAVICELLGVPDADRDRFSFLAGRAISFDGPLAIVRAIGAIGRIASFVREQVAAVRRSPRPGLIGELVHAEEDGDALSEDELVAMVILLLIAGSETTTHLISDSVVALEANPEQKAWLLADPAGRAERAVEELARFSTPVELTKPRWVARDVAFFGEQLQKGELIVASLAAANADPAEFEAPGRLRLDRFPNPHMVFGAGIHFCLGQQLARVETQSALTRLYARFPDLALAGGDVAWLERLGLRGPRTLPVRLNSPARRLAA
jgi:cytochrome P450